MKVKASLVIAIVLISIWSLNSCAPGKSDSQIAESMSKDSVVNLVKRGQYLVTILGCNDCHSPKHMGPHGPEIDSLNMLSGFPANNPVPVVDPGMIKKGLVVFSGDLTCSTGPWGTTFAANITSDETGIGNWTEEQFKKALREGKDKGLDNGRMIMPPMPWQDFTHLTDADLKAIFYYLKSTRPFKNVPPPFRPAAAS